MIDYIKGEITELMPASVTVEAYGIGYFLQISLNTYSAINQRKEVKLFVYESIREDAYALYGFADKHERDVFIYLISVSGVGASTARMILSSMTTVELESVIATGNVNQLKMVKGIGLKTAQRIIVDLKDKIQKIGSEAGTHELFAEASAVAEEAIAALVMLGFAQNASQKAVSAILKQTSAADIEQVIKAALKIL
ncbi:MAG: Holliday junction branch migration protein RuvA [Dysgonamonadaceae bacterium]